MFGLLDTRRPRLLLTLFCLLLWLPGFFTLPPGDRDESRFAQGTKQILETGDYVRIMNGIEARNRKPIGIYWAQAPFVAAADALGIARANPIWPYRLPSLIGVYVAVLACFGLGERMLGRRAALLAGGFLAASFLVATEARIAKTDGALLGCTMLAMAMLGRAYLDRPSVRPGHAALFWLAVAGGILLKGPITPMVAGLTALCLVIADRRARWLLALRPGWGVPLMLVAVLPWFIAIEVATHGQFLTESVGGDLGRKLTSGDDTHGAPPGTHLLLVSALMLPAAAILPGALLRSWRERRDPVARFLLAWLFPSWIVFEAAPTKLPHYPLPLYPALCLLAAWWLLRRDRAPIWRLAAAVPVALATVLAGVVFAVPILLHASWLLGLPAALAGVVIAAVYLPLLRRPDASRHEREIRSVLAGLGGMVWLYAGVFGVELPWLRPLWFAPQIVAAMPPGRLAAVGFSEPSLMFLAGTDTEWFNAEDGAKQLAAGQVTSLAVSDRDLRSVLDWLGRLGVRPTERAAVTGYNYSRGRSTTLTLLTRGPEKTP